MNTVGSSACWPHPDPVAEDGPPAEGRRGVDGQDAHLRHVLGVGLGPPGAGLGDEAVGQRGLAGARRAGQPEGERHLGPVGEARHRHGRLAAALDVREQAGQRDPAPVPGLVPGARPDRRRAPGSPARHLGPQRAQCARQVLVARARCGARRSPPSRPRRRGRPAPGPRRPGCPGRAPVRRRGEARPARRRGAPRSGCRRPSAAAPRRSGSAPRTGSRSGSPPRRPP